MGLKLSLLARRPLALLLLPLAGPVCADYPAPELVTVTASREPRPLGELAASLSVVSGEELLQSAAVHVSEALAGQAGVWINRGNGQEHLTAIRSPVLTGAGSCGAFAVVKDGVPVRATGFCNVNQLFDVNTEQAARIEVLKGPAPVLYGSDAQHGVINVLSGDPLANTGNLTFELGPSDYRRVKLNQGAVNGSHAFGIAVNGTGDGGFKRDSGFDQQKMTGRHDYLGADISVRTLLSVNNLNQETAGYVYGRGAYKDAARKRENPNPEAFRDSRSVRLQSRFELSGEGGDLWVLTPYARYTDMAFLMHFLPGTPLEENGQRSLGLQSAYVGDLSNALTATLGFDLEATDAWLRQSQEEGFSVFPAGRQYDYRVNALVAALFGSFDYELSDVSRATFGARHQILRYRYDNRMRDGDTGEDGSVCISSFTGAEGCRYSRPADRRDLFENTSVEFGLVHEFSPVLLGVAKMARGYRAPQATELYRLQNGQRRADLDAESIDSVEFGLRGGGGTLQFDLVTFYQEKKDVVFQSSDRLNLSDGATRHYGFEYDLRWQLPRNWRLAFTGTLARHRYTADVTAPGSNDLIETAGNDIDTAPRRLFAVRLGWEPSQSTQAELAWDHTGAYFTDIENRYRYDGHELLTLRLRQQLSERATVGVRVRNLANVDYAERADFSRLGGGERYFIGEPRSVYVDLSLAL
ncbi:TonB-dependent receptor [Microbulbifer sp. 2201CG32-9]|uniref:TonB-dependent receptor n=1 Tax=Microbulbifer sp. 2201CG32-9 TaxID=3232309 RepID=UPI00345B8C38